MIITETHSSSSYKYEYKFSGNHVTTYHRRSYSFSFIHKLREIFLPQGYPESVSDDYLQYQMWDTIQALASSVTSTIANQAVLKGIGVGDKTASLLGASLTWITKDGIGLVSRILFAYAKGTFLDCNCKRWRLVADVLNDLAIFIDIFASYVPRPMFVFFICGSSICRSIVGVAGGATRAALTMHQARRNNMADVSAKDGSQECLSNLAGLVINLLVISLVTGNSLLMNTLVVVLTIVHLYSNYKAIKSVKMASFNQSRLHYVVNTWLLTGVMPSVRNGNLAEPVLSSLHRYRIQDVKVGCSVKCLPASMLNDLFSYSQHFKNEAYVLFFDKSRKNCATVFIILKQGASDHDQLKAVFQAEIIDYWLSLTDKSPDFMSLKQSSAGSHNINSLMDMDNIEVQSLMKCNILINTFKKSAEDQGWTFDPLLLGADEWRVNV